MMTQGTMESDTGGDSKSEAAADGAIDTADWKLAHTELVRLAALRASLDWDEGRSLAIGVALRRPLEARVWLIFRVRGAALWLSAAFHAGKAARRRGARRAAGARPRPSRRSAQLVRGPRADAGGDTHHREAWIEAARGRAMRDVEKLVSGRKPGDRPDDPASPEANVTRCASTFRRKCLATFRDAMAKLRRDTGGKLDDDAALLLMARQVLGGPVDSARSSYQLSLTVCERCRQAYQHGAGERVEVGTEVVAMAECDAQRIGHAHVDAPARADVAETPKPTRVTQSIPPAVRRRVLERDGRKCSVPGCRHSQYLDLHHLLPRAEGGDHEPGKADHALRRASSRGPRGRARRDRQLLERLRVPPRRRQTLWRRSFTRGVRAAAESVSRPLRSGLSRDRRAQSDRSGGCQRGRRRTYDGGDTLASGAAGPRLSRVYLKPFRCTTYHWPRQEIIDVSSRLLGSCHRQREAKLRAQVRDGSRPVALAPGLHPARLVLGNLDRRELCVFGAGPRARWYSCTLRSKAATRRSFQSRSGF